MSVRAYSIKAEWDDEAKVWYVSHSDVPGLAAEADTPNELVDLLSELVPELIEINGDKGTVEIPYSLILDGLMARATA